MKIVKHRESNESEMGITVITFGGAKDGMTFRAVEALLDNGEYRWFYVCNCKEGYFRSVFVPWDFEHAEVIG